MKNKKNILILFSFLIIEILFFISAQYYHNKEINEHLQKSTSTLDVKINTMTKSWFLATPTTFVSQIINQPKITKLYSKAYLATAERKQEIRDSLYNMLIINYEFLKIQGVRQLHFHLPDNESFLRFHRPYKFGDNLTNFRYSVKMTNKNKRNYSGFEEGRIFNGFRYVFPLYHQTKHIGSVEISFSFKAIELILRKHWYNNAGFMLNKKVVNTKVFESEKSNYTQSILSDNYLHEKDFMCYGSDNHDILKQIDKKISPKIQQQLSDNRNFTVYQKIENDYYTISFISIKNVEGKPIAYIFAYNKDNMIAQYKSWNLLTQILGLILIGLIAFFSMRIAIKNRKIKEQNNDIQKRESRFRKLINTFENGLYINDENYNITYLNKPMTEKVEGDKTGQKCYKTIYNLDEKCSWCIFDELKTKKRINYDLTIDKNNNYLTVRNILLEDNSKLTFFHDITARKKAELELQESLNQIEVINANTPNIIWKSDIDKNGKFVNNYISNVVDEFLSLPQGTINNSWDKYFSFIKPEYLQTINNKFKQAIANPGTLGSFDYEVKKANGETAWFSSKGRVYYENDKLTVYGSTIDITDLKKAEQTLKESEQKLKESNATKDKFFSIIAHDLKSPFNAIIGFSDLLLKNHTKYNSEKLEKLINPINKSAKSTFKLLENLLDWSRSQTGNLKFIPKEISLSVIFENIRNQTESVAKQKEINLQFELNDNTMIYADEYMVNTIIRNLISNAIKFTPKNGKITVNAKQLEENKFIQVTIKDTGVGIPKDKIKDLFRIDKDTSTKGTEKETGTGLGLILSKEFVEKHGGKIWVESEIDKGSSFCFTIP
jgi:nitrogen-specific signal transduction histidine kinase